MCELSSNSWWSPSTKFLEITRHSLSMLMVSKPSPMTSMSLNYTQVDVIRSVQNSCHVPLCNFFLSFCRTEVIIYLVERSPNGTSKRIPATTLFSYLEQANIKAQLAQIGVVMSATRAELSPAQLKQLLQNAPAGQRMEACLCFCPFQQMLIPWWFFLCRSGPNHLGASQGRQPWSWEVS